MTFDNGPAFPQINGHDFKRPVLEMPVKVYEGRKLLPAPWSPCGPEAEENHLAAVLFEGYIWSFNGWELEIRSLDSLFI